MVERAPGTRVVWREARGSRKSRGRLAVEELLKVPWEALWASSSGMRRELTQLTMDHTFVGQEIRAGRLTKDEARRHPYRAHLLRVLGMSRTVDVDVHRARLQPGDRLLICSDGLSRMLPEDEIALLLAEGPPSEAVWSLVGAANQAGGRDNVSAVVVSVNA